MADIASSIQLLPETRTNITVAVPGENRWLIMGTGVLLVSLLIYGGLFMYARGFPAKLGAVDREFKELDARRSKDSEAQLLILKDQLATVGKVLDDHLVWSSLLSKIESKTSPQLKYKSLAMVFSNESLDIEAEAANFSVIAKQIASYYAEDSIEEVSLSESSLLNNGRISFRLQIKIKPDKIQLQSLAQK